MIKFIGYIIPIYTIIIDVITEKFVVISHILGFKKPTP